MNCSAERVVVLRSPGLVVAVVEAHGAVVGELIEAAVGDGDTEEIAAQVVEDLFAAASGFAVDDPGFFPGGFGDERVEAGLLQAVAKTCRGRLQTADARGGRSDGASP